LFREIFRKSLWDIPESLDLVINAKSGCVGIRYSDLQSEFVDAARKAARRRITKESRTNANPLSKENQP